MRISGLSAKKITLLGSIFAASFIVCTGCGQINTDTQENSVVVVSGEETGPTYNLEEVKRGTVVSSKSLTCVYVQAKQQEVAFSEGGKTIEKIHVREGDYVKTGDLLAEVSTGTLEEDIAALEYKIAKDELEMGYLGAHEDFELRDSYYKMVYYSPREEEDVEEQEERDEDIRESYQYKREDYQDEQEFDKAELEKLKAEFASSRLLASMDGVVYSVQRGLEGTTSTRDEVIMTIIDGTQGMFEMEEPEYMQYFSEDDIINLEITYGSAAGAYEVTPTKMDEWSEKQYFSVYSGPDNDGIEVGTKASIQMVLDEKEDVIYLPNECIYKADDKSYVYVLDEQNMQTACWIETGLVGDAVTEVISGLNEGDMVVKR